MVRGEKFPALAGTPIEKKSGVLGIIILSGSGQCGVLAVYLEGARMVITLVVRPEPVLEGGLLELDEHWDEQAVFADGDEVTSAKEAPHSEVV